MASLEENYHFWNNVYDWSRYAGDEWSARWGGADMQWHFALLPRLSRFVPCGTLLEIGAGYGRWSHYLKDRCQRLYLVDLAERCIHACKQRFADQSHLHYRVSDGKSLPGVEDASVDLVFSFESLVHAEADVMQAYTAEIRRVLRPGGAAFLHHSNLGEYAGYFTATAGIPRRLRRPFKRAALLDFGEWRARSMTASLFRQQAEAAGLACLSQELITWGGRRLIDCISTLRRPDGSLLPQCRVVENREFTRRAFQIQRISPLYGEGVPW